MTMTQYEKRKLKEAEADITEKRNEKREKKLSKQEASVELTEKAYDIINIGGRPHVVIIAYNAEAKKAEIEIVSPINKSIAIPFANKKKALQTLTKDLYKIEK